MTIKNFWVRINHIGWQTEKLVTDENEKEQFFYDGRVNHNGRKIDAYFLRYENEADRYCHGNYRIFLSGDGKTYKIAGASAPAGR